MGATYAPQTERERLLHDLSNKLSTIIVNIGYLRGQFKKRTESEALDDIETAANQSVELFRQLRKA
jgi:hypothetical protein